MGKPERTVLAIGGGVLALVVLTVVLALTFGSADPASFEPGSPEAALQDYARALRDVDRAAALALLTNDARAQVEQDQYFPSSYCGGSDDRRVRVDHTEIAGNHATIYVTVQESSSSVFDFDQYEYQQTVPMLREDGANWKVDQPYTCF